MLNGSMPGTGWKVKVRREARRQVGLPARRAPATLIDPTSTAMSSSARMSCMGHSVGARQQAAGAALFDQRWLIKVGKGREWSWRGSMWDPTPACPPRGSAAGGCWRTGVRPPPVHAALRDGACARTQLGNSPKQQLLGREEPSRGSVGPCSLAAGCRAGSRYSTAPAPARQPCLPASLPRCRLE